MRRDNPPPADSFESFGALLRFLRVRARLSQRELSIGVGYSEAHLSRLEQGQRRPDLDVVRARILPVLGLEADDLLADRLLELAAGPDGSQEPAPPTAMPAPLDAEQLLTTKLAHPPLRHRVVQRSRLLARLAGAEAQLTLVTAPPGFGKTTLVSLWLSHVERGTQNVERPGSESADPVLGSTFYALRSAWLSLDAGENDPARFVRYVVAALRTAAPGVGEGTLALLRAVPPSPMPVLLTPLLNDLAGLPHHVALMLDDYHVIETPAVHAALAFLIDRAPPHLHLVIATRADPPLPLTRLRANGQLVEIRAHDLRFDRAEAEAFLREGMGLQLDAAEVAALESRTEGWAAGLQLAALALREQPDQSRFVRDFTATSRYIADYLAEEVLDRLPTYLRSFVLQTAILDRLNGPLCDAVLGLSETASRGTDSYSQLVLQELERRNLFLTPLDDTRQWYRYHALFAEAARARLLSGASPDERALLFRRAAAAEPARERGVEYLLTGKLWYEAAQQVEELAEALLTSGQHRTVQRWITAFPVDQVEARPRLVVLRGLATVWDGELAGAEALLVRGMVGCARLGDAHGQSLALIDLAKLAMLQGDLPRSLVHIEAALALDVSAGQRAQTLMLAIGAASFGARAADVTRHADELFDLLALGDVRHLYADILSGAHSLVVCLLNRLGPIEALCRAGLATFGVQVSLARAGAHVGLAHIAWLRGRFDEALALVEQVRASSAHFGTYLYAEPQLLSIEGSVAMARSDLETATERFARSVHTGRPLGLYSFAHTGQLYSLARVCWQLQQLDDVRELAARAAQATTEGVPLSGAMRDLLAALVALADGRDDDAETLLAPLAAREHEVGLMAVFGSAHPLRAYLALKRGDTVAAAAALGPLLEACARDGTPGRLLMEGPYIIPLLRAAVAHRVLPDIAAAALAQTHTATDDPTFEPAGSRFDAQT